MNPKSVTIEQRDNNIGPPNNRNTTDMDDVAVLIQHDIAVVSVLDLQQVTHDTVRRHAHHEVSSSLKANSISEDHKTRIEQMHGNIKAQICLSTAKPLAWIRILLGALILQGIIRGSIWNAKSFQFNDDITPIALNQLP